jgi:hypothetical protein
MEHEAREAHGAPARSASGRARPSRDLAAAETSSIAAHELRTPLTALHLSSGHAARRASSSDAQAASAAKTEREAQQDRTARSRLNDLVEPGCWMARVVRALRWSQPGDLAVVVAGWSRTPRARARQWVSDPTRGGKLPRRMGPSACRTVVSELLSNAINYGAQKPIYSPHRYARHGDPHRLRSRNRPPAEDVERIFGASRAVRDRNVAGLGNWPLSLETSSTLPGRRSGRQLARPRLGIHRRAPRRLRLGPAMSRCPQARRSRSSMMIAAIRGTTSRCSPTRRTNPWPSPMARLSAAVDPHGQPSVSSSTTVCRSWTVGSFMRSEQQRRVELDTRHPFGRVNHAQSAEAMGSVSVYQAQWTFRNRSRRSRASPRTRQRPATGRGAGHRQSGKLITELSLATNGSARHEPLRRRR